MHAGHRKHGAHVMMLCCCCLLSHPCTFDDLPNFNDIGKWTCMIICRTHIQCETSCGFWPHPQNAYKLEAALSAIVFDDTMPITTTVIHVFL